MFTFCLLSLGFLRHLTDKHALSSLTDRYSPALHFVDYRQQKCAWQKKVPEI
jgi:hypothetical protein